MNKKIKIFFFHPYSKIGGADLSISNLINSLSTKDYDFNLICLDKQKISSYLKKKIQIYSIKKKRVSLSILDIRKIIKKNININQKTIFVSNQYFANIIAVISLFGLKNLKKIFLERNHINELSYYNNFFDFLKKKIIKFLLNYFYKFADLVICNSKLSAIDLKKNISVPVQYIYNPTYLKKKFDKYKKNKLYPYKYIINVSRFEKQKDHMTLLKSFKNIQQFTNYHLILIGYGSEEINIKNYIKNNFLENYVKIIKNLNNALPYIKNAELFILTSVYEGLPNVLIESIALGTPVISSNCKSGPSEILLNGKGGDLFKQGDHDRLSEQIIAHYKNPYILKKKLLLSQKYLFRFDQNLISKKFDNVFRSI